MNAFATLLGSPLAQAIGWALVHLLWQGVIVAAILAATLALLAKQSANARYLASCAALVALLVLGTATTFRAYAANGERVVGSGSTTLTAAQVASPPLWIPVSNSPHPTPHTPFITAHLPHILLAWIVGVLFLSVRLLAGWVRAHEIATRNAVPAAPEWQRVAVRLAALLQLRRAVALLESAAVEVPTVIGWLRPVVLLPAATLTGLSTEQMEMILAHELAHIRRNDFFVNLLQAVVETLFFYHPAVWWMSHRIRVERENCCDDAAVSVCGNALLYARALTRLEELRADAPHTVLAANGGSLIERIRRLAGARAESPNAPSRFVAGLALLTVLVALLVAPSLPLGAQQQKVKETAPAATPKPATTTVDVRARDADDDANADDRDDNEDNAPDAEQAAEAMPAIAPMPSFPRVAAIGPLPSFAPMAAVAPAIANALAIAARPLPAIEIGDINIDNADAPRVARAPRAPRRHEREIGTGGKLSVDDLIELRASGVTAAYIDEMRNAGLGELSLNDIVSMKVQGVTSDYIRTMRASGLALDARTLTELRAMGVTTDYIAQMRAAGYANLGARELVDLKAMGVSPHYIEQLASAGYHNLTAHQLIELKAQGVTPDFIKSLSDAGYTNLSVKDLVRMAAMGVNADFIRDLSKYKTGSRKQ